LVANLESVKLFPNYENSLTKEALVQELLDIYEREVFSKPLTTEALVQKLLDIYEKEVFSKKQF